MAGRKKSDWKVKEEELKAALPKNFRARFFRGAKTDGKLDKSVVGKVCEEKGMKDKADAIFAFLNHMDNKPVSKKGKGKAKKQSVEAVSAKTLLAKRTYKDLTAAQLDKVMAILPEIQKAREDKELEEAKQIVEKAQKRVDEIEKKQKKQKALAK